MPVDYQRETPPVPIEDPADTISPAEAKFERLRKLSGVVLTPIVFAITFFLVGRTSLGYEGRMLSAILSAIAVLWMTESLPLPVTALFGAVLCIVLGVAPAKEVLAPFADPFIFLFLASFILAQSMMLHGLDRRIALRFLALPGIGASPARVLAGVGAITAVLSMWVSNTATTAMMLPIALGVLGALHHCRLASGMARGPMDVRTWPYATGMMLMVAYAASIGGIGTPVGSPPNLIGLGLLKKNVGIDIGFFTWMAMMVPMLVVMAAVLFVLLYWLHPEQKSSKVTAVSTSKTESVELRRYLDQEISNLGLWTKGQVNTLIAFLVAIALWIAPGIIAVAGKQQTPVGLWFKNRMPEAVAAMVAAILLFILPTNLSSGKFTMTWREAKKIDWGTLLLFGGGLSLGGLMESTGVAAALGNGVIGATGNPGLWMLTAAAIAMGIFLSETTSNTAAATMLVPVMIPLATSAGASPVPPVLGAILGASYGFMLPVSTPPNAIVYGSGLVPIPKMVRAGILFDIIGGVVIFCGLRLLCPLFGFS